MTIALVDHVTAGLARVAQQYRESPQFLSLLEIFLQTVQEYEAAIVALDAITIDNATGYYLRNFGKVVVEPFGDSASDTDYRRRVKAKGIINRSQGTVEFIIAALRAAGAAAVRVRQYAPAAILVEITGGASSVSQVTTYQRTQERVRAAGIGSQLVTLADTDDETFTIPYGSFLNGSHSAGATTLTVHTTAGTPTTGTLVLAEGLASQEEVDYVSRTATTYTLDPSTPLVNPQASWTPVIWKDSPGKGVGDSSDPAVGGKLAGIVSA